MTFRVRDLSLVLCLLLRRVLSDFVVEDLQSVDGLINQHVTLPCSIILPDNWRDHEIHIIWYRNFSDKLLDCSVSDGMMPACQEPPDSSRVQLSWKFLGNADLDISSLQESDEGHYQCWIIFEDAYQRRDTYLQVHNVTSTTWEASPHQQFVGWQSMVMVSTCNVLLLSAWSFAFLFAGILLSQRCHNHRKKTFIII
ncbi:uncharacterized protein ACMZJ9_010472 isoform 1-T1 [Mantella aurantiaca]